MMADDHSTFVLNVKREMKGCWIRSSPERKMQVVGLVANFHYRDGTKNPESPRGTIHITPGNLNDLLAYAMSLNDKEQTMNTNYMHASAPEGCLCGDCTLAKEACPACHKAGWSRAHPDFSQATEKSEPKQRGVTPSMVIVDDAAFFPEPTTPEAAPDVQYETMMRHIRDNGRYKGDRTGTGTTSIFGYQLRYDLSKGFPLVTTKKVALKSVITELLWFLRGDTNVKWLQERGCTIWDEWADKDGNLGPVYGAQWRAWPGQVDVTAPGGAVPPGCNTLVEIASTDIDGKGRPPATVYQKPIDQIDWVINRLKTNPDCRRIIVSAWNVAELSKMALMPCHCLFQFYSHELTVDERAKLYEGPGLVGSWSLHDEDAAAIEAHMHKFLDEQQVPRRALSCQLYQRSCDTFLGVPFNIASYAMLTHMIAQQVGMAVGDFVWTGGDVHLYKSHTQQVETQLARVGEAYPFPTLRLKRKPESIFDYEPEDFEVLNYRHHPSIKAPVAV